ncbi:MaoC family dehydratase N-terminal domain-containing protein [Alphaproteobacteria bacterium]|nr:MaoC family dehydratase N-terminal domain-containing protein [Alphaproteobacteria bacterium]
MNQIEINIDELKTWIGSSEESVDEVSISLEKRFKATLDLDPGNPAKGDEASSGIHWTLGPAVVKSSLLGKDSHPEKGSFLPPVPLPRRMWAGCETEFFSPLYIGDIVTKKSTIVDITIKNGKSGLLCFVKAKYEFLVESHLIIEEYHDIVYRELQTIDKSKIPKINLPNFVSSYEENFFAHPTTLFRYSAITFNGHRIHYDYPYSTKEEGYKDLVFHGPLQATLLLRAAEKFKKVKAKKFVHKGIAPVFANNDLLINIEDTNNGLLNCYTSTKDAGLTMKAQATF